MKSWKKPTDELIDRALASVRKETDRRYFFSRLKNPLWLQPLKERGYFKVPPRASDLLDGSVWPELQYLKNVSGNDPEEIIRLLLQLPEVDNLWVYDCILEIALQLSGELSSKLMPKILECARVKRPFLAGKYSDLLAYWTVENQTSAALELAKILVHFAPDPETEDKRKRRRENPQDWTILLDPSPQFDEWEYKEILEKGVRPLAEKESYGVARVLIDATTKMINLRIHQEKLVLGSDEDHSEIWCRRLDKPGSHYQDSKETLVHALTIACEKVFERAPDSVAALDEALRNQRWKVFKRLRQHLYALHPIEQTRPLIRDLILKHEDYDQWEHHYEFQQMIRCACEHFGADLLTEKERALIFDTIMNGPSKAHYSEWLGERFTDELFEQRQRAFHRKQLRPFVFVLFGKYASYFQELEDEAAAPVSDEDYGPVGVTMSGWMRRRSPRPAADLEVLSDEALLAYINEWDAEHRDEDDSFVETTIEALAEAFQTVFKQSVLPDIKRFRFWIENRDRVQRPIYVRAMIDAMQDYIKEGNFSHIEESLAFCEWVLSHPDQEPRRGYEFGDKSRENPNWHSSRRAVEDLVGTCLKGDLDVPMSTQKQLLKLLDMLCTQFDWRLDESAPLLSDRSDQLVEAINNTRSSALEDLVTFGFWLRRNDPQADVSAIKIILEKRLTPETEYPLTLPERAILGSNYRQMLGLDEAWATEHRSDFFPRDTLPEWLEAFGSFLRFNHPHGPTFRILRGDFGFALQHLAVLDKQEHDGSGLTDTLGQHLFTYYLWEMYPLKGAGSLIEQFYRGTSGDRERWMSLFNHVGLSLRNTSEYLDRSLKDRLIAFFEWRLEVRDASELGKFDHWLSAECLEPEWRLDAYSRILDIGQPGGWWSYGQVEALYRMLSDHTVKVVECFAKLTDILKNDALYIQKEKAKQIVNAGLVSGEEEVRNNAMRARENLLRRGHFDLLEVDG